MKQVLVLSGKGGTGKTTIVAAFAYLLKAKAFADCDVDAPNLHLVTKMKSEPIIDNYYGMEKAHIDEEVCIKCGKCYQSCRFGAIVSKNDGEYQVNALACEGCSVCEAVCPVGAVSMGELPDGQTKIYKDDRVFSTATLKMGSGTSGKLVSRVKKNLLDNTSEEVEIALVDGSPGIGCPVISSISGVHLILLVTEPTVSGMSDMKRVIDIANHFKVPVAVCTNKYDVNQEKTDQIKDYALKAGCKYVGVIPYDRGVAKVTNTGKSVMEMETKAKPYIEDLFKQTMKLI